MHTAHEASTEIDKLRPCAAFVFSLPSMKFIFALQKSQNKYRNIYKFPLNLTESKNNNNNDGISIISFPPHHFNPLRQN